MAVDLAAPGKRKGVPVPVYVAAAIALIGVAVFAYFALSPARPAQEIPLSAEGKAYIKNLQLSDVNMKANGNYASQMLVEIEGKIANTGDRPVDAVEIYCVFRDPAGQMIYKPRMAIVSPKMGGLKPGETKSFRLPFDEVPDEWNNAMPQLVVAGVKFS